MRSGADRRDFAVEIGAPISFEALKRPRIGKVLAVS